MSIVLNLAGKHNVLNALAAVAVARKLQVQEAMIQQAFRDFMGIGRRFQMYGELSLATGKFLLIDDYGHHPREIAATLDAIRLVWPNTSFGNGISATPLYKNASFNGMILRPCMSDTDVLLLLDVYSAGEEPIAGADGHPFVEAIFRVGKV